MSLIGAVTMFSVMIAALWRTDDPAAVTSFMRVGLIGNVLVTVGSLGTVIFGVWLAISLDAYQLWDGWVLAATGRVAPGTTADDGAGLAGDFFRWLLQREELTLSKRGWIAFGQPRVAAKEAVEFICYT